MTEPFVTVHHICETDLYVVFYTFFLNTYCTLHELKQNMLNDPDKKRDSMGGHF